MRIEPTKNNLTFRQKEQSMAIYATRLQPDDRCQTNVYFTSQDIEIFQQHFGVYGDCANQRWASQLLQLSSLNRWNLAPPHVPVSRAARIVALEKGGLLPSQQVAKKTQRDMFSSSYRWFPPTCSFSAEKLASGNQTQLPSGYLTQLWKMAHLQMIFPLKPPFIRDFPQLC